MEIKKKRKGRRPKRISPVKREELNKAIEDYIKRGGTITQVVVNSDTELPGDYDGDDTKFTKEFIVSVNIIAGTGLPGDFGYSFV